MRVTLCGEKGCCRTVEFEGNTVKIGENNNTVILNRSEWNGLVRKVRSGELKEL